MPAPFKQLDFALTTSSGEVDVHVNIPTTFIRITEIVPVIRSMGEQVQATEVFSAVRTGKEITCQKGCSACCQRIMVPVSPPEAFALEKAFETLSPDHAQRIRDRLTKVLDRLHQVGLLAALQDLAESPTQRTDEDLEAINQTYYNLHLPCIFLENDACSIYEHRPAACREYLVTSPAELCLDTEHNPVQELPIPLRAGTVLSILWADLMGGPVRLIPLPIVFAWVDRHRPSLEQRWNGLELFDRALEGLTKFLRKSRQSVSKKALSN